MWLFCNNEWWKWCDSWHQRCTWRPTKYPCPLCPGSSWPSQLNTAPVPPLHWWPAEVQLTGSIPMVGLVDDALLVKIRLLKAVLTGRALALQWVLLSLGSHDSGHRDKGENHLEPKESYKNPDEKPPQPPCTTSSIRFFLLLVFPHLWRVGTEYGQWQGFQLMAHEVTCGRQFCAAYKVLAKLWSIDTKMSYNIYRLWVPVDAQTVDRLKIVRSVENVCIDHLVILLVIAMWFSGCKIGMAESQPKLCIIVFKNVLIMHVMIHF